MTKVLFISIIILFSSSITAQLSESTITKVTQLVNSERAKGHKCGGEKMPPVHPLLWQDQLYNVSQDYAQYMKKNNHFAHLSKEGEDAGDRLDKVGYNWQYVGENLAMGQDDFHEVLNDWLRSPLHCKMLMSEDMHHFAVAKDGKYWVQTFATPMR